MVFIFIIIKKEKLGILKIRYNQFLHKTFQVDDIPAHLDFITTCVHDNKQKLRALLLIAIRQIINVYTFIYKIYQFIHSTLFLVYV